MATRKGTNNDLQYNTQKAKVARTPLKTRGELSAPEGQAVIAELSASEGQAVIAPIGIFVVLIFFGDYNFISQTLDNQQVNTIFDVILQITVVIVPDITLRGYKERHTKKHTAPIT